GVVGVLVASGDLVDALAQQGQHVMGHIAAIPIVRNCRAECRRQPQPLVEFPDEQQPSVARDLAAIEGSRDLLLESEAESIMTLCSHRHPSSACSTLASTTASIAHFRGVGGFFTPSGVNYPGLGPMPVTLHGTSDDAGDCGDSCSS